ncbi:MAG: dihydroneopterin aldolase [Bacteroidota bacterium]|nr:dihydroneopterin aldolase [Bacteroidota bacterium]
MLTVHLKDLVFYGRHGVYAGETETGAAFQASLSVSYDETTHDLDKLTGVLNYEELFAIIKQHMDTPTALLEQVADAILITLHQRYPYVKHALVSIWKLEPPIPHFQGKVGVTLERLF